MVKKPKDIFEHMRREVPGPKGSALEKWVYETRGARRLAFEIFKNPDLTAIAAQMKDGPSDTYSLLFNGANHWLKEANEADFFGAASIAEDEAKKGKDSAIESLVMTLWAAQVGRRNGYLSPAGIAAHFLAMSDHLHRLVDGKEELLNAIYAFADAWHWAHFEGMGEHELAAAGVASQEARAKGPETKKREREQKEKITRDALSVYMAERPQRAVSPKRAASTMMSGLNETLKSLNLHPYQQTSLEKAIRAILKTP